MKRFDIYVNLERTKFNVEVLNSLDETEESFTMDLHEARILHEKLTEALGLSEMGYSKDAPKEMPMFEAVEHLATLAVSTSYHKQCSKQTGHEEHHWWYESELGGLPFLCEGVKPDDSDG